MTFVCVFVSNVDEGALEVRLFSHLLIEIKFKIIVIKKGTVFHPFSVYDIYPRNVKSRKIAVAHCRNAVARWEFTGSQRQ
jgi:hypothetical protein